MAASRLPEIVSGLDLDADAHTFEDLLENEDWWAPYRDRVRAVGAGDGRRGGGDDRRRAAAISAAGRRWSRQAREAGSRVGGRARAQRPRASCWRRRACRAASTRVGRGRDPGRAARTRRRCRPWPTAPEPPSRCRTASGCSRPRVPTPAQTTLAALVGREDRAGEAGIVTLDDGTRRPGRRARPRVVAGRRAAAAAPPPAGTHLGLLIAAAGALLGAAGLIVQLSGRRRAHKVDTDNPMVITRPMGSGQRPHPPIKQQIERTKDLHPPAARGVRARRRGGPARRCGRRGGGARRRRPPARASTLGRYRLLERIGEGGMAEIFIADRPWGGGLPAPPRGQAPPAAPDEQQGRRRPVHR